MTAVLEPSFVLPPEREASGPPESRGLRRDGVRLLVADRESLTHAIFRELPRFLRPGDLVVVNNSATVGAAVSARYGGEDVVVHFATELDDGSWAVEIRSPAGHPVPTMFVSAQAKIELAGDASLTLRAPWLPPARRLWIADVRAAEKIADYLDRVGRPITYAYVRQQWSIEYYQTVFGRHRGSAEMPSAARPFTDELVTDLITAGIALAPITLHTGLSSPEAGEPPSPERFAVPEFTARRVNQTRAQGGRVVAVGTTVTRALESATEPSGIVTPGSGWTDLVLGPDRPARAVDGLITGWHAPGASHLELLESVVGAREVRAAYDAALAEGYLWHEFGDSALLLR